jgi:hypothetical protein
VTRQGILTRGEQREEGALGGSVGSAIGGAIGTAVGGPVGSFVGSFLGRVGGTKRDIRDSPRRTTTSKRRASGLQKIRSGPFQIWSARVPVPFVPLERAA